MKEIFLDVICAVLFEKPLSSVLRTLSVNIACEQALRAKKNEEKARRKESLPASLRNLNAAPKVPC